MERILLVEPDYDNKYPPIGLMKIATYHRNKGDFVEFFKGKAPYSTISKVDRIYVTTLFTFYFDLTVDTIKHYLKYVSVDFVYVGGILATLMPSQLQEATGITHLLTGQLVSSTVLGYDDDVNVDILPLDYDILDDISYQYGMDNNFFSYTTRGCPRKCTFCGVKTLEPVFRTTNHLKDQISYVRDRFGDKRNILLMDNNVLCSPDLERICKDLNDLGFKKDCATYVPENPAKLYFNKIKRRQETQNTTWLITDRFVKYLESFVKRIKRDTVKNSLVRIIEECKGQDVAVEVLVKHRNEIEQIVEKYRAKKALQRYVDFNQGIDARLLTDERMALLSTLPLRPFRLAYDSIDTTEEYYRAFETAYRYGIRHFSNYMLYNFTDTPGDLWERAHNNILLYNKYPDVAAFSFPMKYAPIDRTDRNYVGKHWWKKYLSAMNVILNVTKGVIAKEVDFFERAYGATSEEFYEILAMPNEFIKFRDFFEKNGMIDAWRAAYRALESSEKTELLQALSDGTEYRGKNPQILQFYKITKRKIEKGTKEK